MVTRRVKADDYPRGGCYWLMLALLFGLGGICLVGTVRMIFDDAYAASIVAEGHSLIGQILLGSFGTVFFGAPGVFMVWFHIFLRRQEGNVKLSPPDD